MRYLTIFGLMLVAVSASATVAERTLTLTTPLAMPTCASLQVVNVEQQGDNVVVVAYCFESGSPIKGTRIVATLNEFGARFSGAGMSRVTPQGARWEADIDLDGDGELDGPGCDATKSQFYSFWKTLHNADPAPEEPAHRTGKELLIRCLGGS